MTGHTFVSEVNAVLEALKCYYNGKTEFNKGSRLEGKFLVWDKMVGDPLAFEKYVTATWKKLPTSTVAVCISVAADSDCTFTKARLIRW